MNNDGFIRHFKKNIKGFDDSKIAFEVLGKYDGINIVFIVDGKLKRCNVGSGTFWVELWKPHFEEYLKTGHFDFNSYWVLYEDKDIASKDIGKVFKFPLKKEKLNDCFESTPEMFKFLDDYRKKHPKCGIRNIPRPD